MKLFTIYGSRLTENFVQRTSRLKEGAGVFWLKTTEDKISFILSLISLFFLIFNFLFLIFNFGNLPPEIPLFYSKVWGEKRLAPVRTLWLLPGLGLGLWFFNTVMAVKIFREKNLTRLLFFYQVLIEALLTLTLVKIILLVGFI